MAAGGGGAGEVEVQAAVGGVGGKGGGAASNIANSLATTHSINKELSPSNPEAGIQFYKDWLSTKKRISESEHHPCMMSVGTHCLHPLWGFGMRRALMMQFELQKARDKSIQA